MVDHVGDCSDDEVRVVAVDEVIARLGMQVNAALRQESQLCLELLPDGLGLPRQGDASSAPLVITVSGNHPRLPGVPSTTRATSWATALPTEVTRFSGRTAA